MTTSDGEQLNHFTIRNLPYKLGISSGGQGVSDEAALKDRFGWLGPALTSQGGFRETGDPTTGQVADILVALLVNQGIEWMIEGEVFQNDYDTKLVERWGPVLDGLRLFRTMVGRFAQEANTVYGGVARQNQDLTFQVLQRIHQRSVIVAGEVDALVRSGYASGALARWRTLHEFRIVAHVIDKYGDQIAHRFERHHYARTTAHAESYEEHWRKYSDEAPPANLLTEAQQRRDDLVREFGPGFDDDYGWANGFIEPQPGRKGGKRTRLNLFDLEVNVGADAWRPWIMLSHTSIHANHFSSTFDIGWPGMGFEAIIAGPSVFGLGDPIGCTTLALLGTTALLLKRAQGYQHELPVAGLTVLQQAIEYKAKLIEPPEGSERSHNDR